MSKPYTTCRHCGAHLDIGETCDCKDGSGDLSVAEDEADRRESLLDD